MKPKYFIVSGTDYHVLIKRFEQYVPDYLARNRKVYYFEYPQFTKLIKILTGKLPFIEHITDNLFVIHSFGIFPFGRTLGLINNLNHKLTYILASSFLPKEFSDGCIIFFTPEAFYLPINKMAQKFFYIITDNYISLPYWSNFLQKRQFTYLEKSILNMCTKIVTVSSTLFQKYKVNYSQTTYFQIPINIKSLSYLKKSLDRKKKLENIPSPKVGFVGALYDWRIDIKLLIKTLATFPNISFVFIGPIQIKDPLSRKTLLSMKNFFSINTIKNHDLPNYMKEFEAAIIPYKTNSYGEYAYPVKINEYLAMGLPTISTKLPAIRYLADKKLIYWAQNDREFIQYIKLALKEKKSSRINKRMKEAQRNSWTSRVQDLIHLFET